jgi:Zn ribbon nucleic-acid-binding protein
MDKIVAYSKDGTDYRECVSCGFLDEIRISSSPNELITRVTKGMRSKSEPYSDSQNTRSLGIIVLKIIIIFVFWSSSAFISRWFQDDIIEVFDS